MMKKKHAQDVALTKATVRKLELQVESLKRSLEEKVGQTRHTLTLSLTLSLSQAREKEGLTQLCDELLAQINPTQAP